MSRQVSPHQYKGIIIAEGLDDPQLINGFSLYKAEISRDGVPIDYEGHTGRWHLYYVNASHEEIKAIQPRIVRGWYAHFWNDKAILVAFNDRLFELNKHDKATWQDAIEHGKKQGIPENELDFPSD